MPWVFAAAGLALAASQAVSASNATRTGSGPKTYTPEEAANLPPNTYREGDTIYYHPKGMPPSVKVPVGTVSNMSAAPGGGGGAPGGGTNAGQNLNGIHGGPMTPEEQAAYDQLTPEQKAKVDAARQVQAKNEALTKSNPAYEQYAQAKMAEMANRQAFQMNATQLGPATTAEAAQIAANERAQNEQIAAFQNAQAANAGPAAQMGTAQINRQDLEGRLGQQKLIGDLQEQAAGRGPSLAGNILREAQDRNAKQGLSMAATMKGNANAALVQRNAMNAVAAGNQGVARDAAQARISEQLNAYNALGQQLGNMRSQDIGVNTTQAGLAQQSMANNMGAYNQFALTNAGFNQAANMYNAQGANLQNYQQAGMNLQNSQFNAGATNQYNQAQAGFNQQTALTNAANQNNFTLQQGTLNNLANVNNFNAQIENRNANDAQTANYYNAAVSQDQANLGRNLSLAQMQANYALGQASQANQNSQFQAVMDQRNTDRLVGAAGGGLSAAAQLYQAYNPPAPPAAAPSVPPNPYPVPSTPTVPPNPY